MERFKSEQSPSALRCKALGLFSLAASMHFLRANPVGGNGAGALSSGILAVLAVGVSFLVRLRLFYLSQLSFPFPAFLPSRKNVSLD
jgi:hypothetical protein